MTKLVKRIYLDNNASSLVDPRVAERMGAVLASNLGNASALHAWGREARRIVEDARTQIASVIGARPEEVIFTSGATEANNLALRSMASQADPQRRKVLVNPMEHPSVLAVCEVLRKDGFELIWMPVLESGLVDLEGSKKLLSDDVAFSTLMWINNETGVMQPVEEWSLACAEAGIPFHCDAAQAVGRVEVNLESVQATMLTCSAHKFHGPQGVGALYIRKETPFHPTLVGGGQEREKRAGTENVVGIAGMGLALKLAEQELAERHTVQKNFSQRLCNALEEHGVKFVLNSQDAPKHPGVLNLRFAGVMAESLLMQLDLKGIAVSVGSACSSGSLDPSHVLSAMGLSVGDNLSSIRVSFSHLNREDEADAFAAAMKEITD